MDILVERDAAASPRRLTEAWSGSRSFVFVPDKARVTREWLATRIDQLPARYSEGCFALLSSGSTGLPRLVVGRKERAERLSVALTDAQSLADVREVIVALPLTYSYAFVNQWVWSHVHGRRLVVTRGVSHPEFDAALNGADGAMLCLVGAQISTLDARSSGPFPGVTRVNFAGGAFPDQRLGDVRRLFPNALVYNNYGCAEAMPRLTVRRAEDHAEGAVVGFPLPGVAMKTSATGEISFQSPFGAIAVVDDAGIRDIGPDTWMESGDLGAQEPNGMWRLTGRTSEVFKRHGEKIALPSLTASLREGWGGEIAFYRERDRVGEDGHVLVLTPQPDETQLRTLLQLLRSRYGRAHWPLRIESVATLPLSANGKPDLEALRDATDKTVHWQQRL